MRSINLDNGEPRTFTLDMLNEPVRCGVEGRCGMFAEVIEHLTLFARKAMVKGEDIDTLPDWFRESPSYWPGE